MKAKFFRLYLTSSLLMINSYSIVLMRTFISIITLTLFTLNNLYAQLPEEQLKNMVVHNDIRSVTQWNHKFIDGKPEKDGYKNAYKEFDKNGNVIKEIYYRRG